MGTSDTAEELQLLSKVSNPLGWDGDAEQGKNDLCGHFEFLIH